MIDQPALGGDLLELEVQDDVVLLRLLAVPLRGGHQQPVQLDVLRIPCEHGVLAQRHEARPADDLRHRPLEPGLDPDLLRHRIHRRIRHGDRPLLRDDAGRPVLAAGLLQRRDAVGQLDLVRERMVHEQRHADLGLVHAVLEPLQEGVVVVETGEDLANGPEDASLLLLRGVAGARARRVAVLIVGQAAAEAVVQAGAR